MRCAVKIPTDKMPNELFFLEFYPDKIPKEIELEKMLNVNKNVRTKYQQIIYYFVCWYFVSWLFFLPPVVIDSFIEWVSKEEPDPPHS